MKEETKKKKEDTVDALKSKFVDRSGEEIKPEPPFPPENFYKIIRIGRTNRVDHFIFVNVVVSVMGKERAVCLVFNEGTMAFFIKRMSHDRYELQDIFAKLKLDKKGHKQWKQEKN